MERGIRRPHSETVLLGQGDPPAGTGPAQRGRRADVGSPRWHGATVKGEVEERKVGYATSRFLEGSVWGVRVYTPGGFTAVIRNP
ncbi:unnamed protein product [Arctogadus glacialis]